MSKCECGCGRQLPAPKFPSRATRFLVGHNFRLSGHRSWRGGVKRGLYVLVRRPEHPRADSQGYVREHVLMVEAVLGKVLPDAAVVHHVNERKHDNRNDNFVLCQDESYHRLLHRRARAFAGCGDAHWRRCPKCKNYDAPESLTIFIDKAGNEHPFHSACQRAVAL